jgi:hypothetical protein
MLLGGGAAAVERIVGIGDGGHRRPVEGFALAVFGRADEVGRVQPRIVAPGPGRLVGQALAAAAAVGRVLARVVDLEAAQHRGELREAGQHAVRDHEHRVRDVGQGVGVDDRGRQRGERGHHRGVHRLARRAEVVRDAAALGQILVVERDRLDRIDRAPAPDALDHPVARISEDVRDLRADAIAPIDQADQRPLGGNGGLAVLWCARGLVERRARHHAGGRRREGDRRQEHRRGRARRRRQVGDDFGDFAHRISRSRSACAR